MLLISLALKLISRITGGGQRKVEHVGSQIFFCRLDTPQHKKKYLHDLFSIYILLCRGNFSHLSPYCVDKQKASPVNAWGTKSDSIIENQFVCDGNFSCLLCHTIHDLKGKCSRVETRQNSNTPTFLSAKTCKL